MNRIFNVLPPLINLDKNKFKTLLRASCAKLQSANPRPDSASPAAIDAAVLLLVNLIFGSARSSSRLPRPPVSSSGPSFHNSHPFDVYRGQIRTDELLVPVFQALPNLSFVHHQVGFIVAVAHGRKSA